RKKDISRVFNAETLIIGFTAGMFGVVITLLLIIPINLILNHLVEIPHLAALKAYHGTLLVLISMVLTLIAGIIPSRIAAKKDPVEALRSE
ncbi:MAG: FtsX-like permease family protein, partial [Bacilli bacterium]